MSGRTQPRLVFLLSGAERSVRRWIDARGRSKDVTAATAGVLFHLARHAGSTMSELSAALRASPAGTTGLVTRMERGGLVTRTQDGSDQRVSRVSLTAAGAAAGREAKDALAELNAALTAGFAPEELDVVARWLGHAERVLDAPPRAGDSRG